MEGQQLYTLMYSKAVTHLYRTVHCTVQGPVPVSQECWPCPPFDILLLEYQISSSYVAQAEVVLGQHSSICIISLPVSYTTLSNLGSLQRRSKQCTYLSELA